MRVKTDAKRTEILVAAAEEFSQRGFHATTLDHIAKRMGSSKATIYNYFPTKGALFGSMLAAAAVPATAAMLQELERGDLLDCGLPAFARAFVRQQTGERPIALQRLLIAESGTSPDTTRPLHATPDVHVWPHVGAAFAREQEKGRLRAGDTTRMSRQLCALLQGDLPLRLLFGSIDRVSDADIDESVQSALAIFLAAYGTKP